MTRNKVELSFIANDTARKASFKKRKAGLLKKVGELSTLCGVDASAIVCSPYDPVPVVWPDRGRAKKVVDDFLDLPDKDRNWKMLDHPSYLNERILKSNQKLAHLQDDNFQKEMTAMMYETVAGEKSLDDVNPVDLKNLLVMIDHNVGEIHRRLRAFHSDQNVGFSAQPQVAGGFGFEQGPGGSGGMQMQDAAPWLIRSLGTAPNTYEVGSSSGATAVGGDPL